MANFILNFVKRALGTGRDQITNDIGNFDSNLIVPEITLLEPANLDGLGSEISARDRPSKADQSLSLLKGSSELLSVDRVLNENEENIDENVDATPIDLNDETAKKLLAKARSSGFMTYDELNAALPQGRISSKQIEDIMSAIEDMGVQIVENYEASYDSKGDDGLLKNNNANELAFGSSGTEDQAINSAVLCSPDGLVLEQPQTHNNSEKPSEFEILEDTIESLIKANSVSVRLRNCSDNEIFRTTSVGFALDNPDEFETSCYQVTNLGRRTFNELKLLIGVSAGRVVSKTFTDISLDGLTLGELVKLSNASTRLTNNLSHSDLSKITVNDAILDPAALETSCYKVPGMGKKSVRELQWLLAECSKELAPGAQTSDQAKLAYVELSGELLQSIATCFDDITLEQICEYTVLSVRLKNGIMGSLFREAKLGELLLDWPETRREMAELQNLGRNSISELNRVCSELISKFLITANIEKELADVAASFTLSGAHISNQSSKLLIEALQDQVNFKISDIGVSEILAPDTITKMLLSELKERPRKIIERRYGIGQNKAETLEQIGIDYSVTRERIRQIEKKALKASSRSAKLLPVRASLVAFGDQVWGRLGGEKGYLTQIDIKNVNRLPANFVFLLDVAGITIEDWLDAFSSRWENGWCAKEIDLSELDATAVSIIADLQGKLLPRPCPVARRPCEIDLAAVVVELKLRKQLHGAYILEANRGARFARRVVELHSLFGSNARPIDAAELAERFASEERRQAISARYITMVMSRHPHLFLEGDDAQWFGIGSKSGWRTTTGFEFALPSSLEGAEGDETFTMVSFLGVLLERTGPMKLTDIVNEARKTLPSDRAIASVGPTLLMCREVFERILPGVYGLRKTTLCDEQLIHRPPDYLVNEDQARLFALGRRAGEPWGAFGLWTPAAEYALCAWAKKHSHSALFESLLTIASIEEWPIAYDKKVEWKELIGTRAGKFHLHFEPRSETGYALPNIKRLLASCLQTKATGKFNWIVGNRILNRTADAHASAGLVALMNALGALHFDPSSNWQMPQHAGQRLGEITNRLEEALHGRGELDWQSPVGLQLLEEAKERGVSMEGWINHRLMISMLNDYANPNAISDHEEESDLDKLLLEFRQGTEASMFDKMLDELASSDDLSGNF
ncbi:RNA polymerase sigma factor region1.1 domain-containing protein [Sphingorhabdus sp.]|jgi:hypothetical protein|uniref:RNA polymerase sigma factor region1.1 domain-containing protein n=1 Tax=Sphingorhabdus sp. TaxID=1902408 RepID=UPI0037C75DB2